MHRDERCSQKLSIESRAIDADRLPARVEKDCRADRAIERVVREKSSLGFQESFGLDRVCESERLKSQSVME